VNWNFQEILTIDPSSAWECDTSGNIPPCGVSCVIKCIVRGNQARVKNADLRHPSCTVVMWKRKSTSPVRNVLSVLVFLPTYITYLLTYSMEQSPSWEVNWFAASQEIHRVLWNPKVHYCTHKRPPPVPILGQTNLVHTPTSHFPKIHLNIILPSTPPTYIISIIIRICPTLTW
jgi:hypothetical protein